MHIHIHIHIYIYIHQGGHEEGLLRQGDGRDRREEGGQVRRGRRKGTNGVGVDAK